MSSIRVSVLSESGVPQRRISLSSLNEFVGNNSDRVLRVDYADGTSTYHTSGDEYDSVEGVITSLSEVDMDIHRLKEQILELERERVLLNCIRVHMESRCEDDEYYSSSDSESSDTSDSSDSDSSDSESSDTSDSSDSDSDSSDSSDSDSDVDN